MIKIIEATDGWELYIPVKAEKIELRRNYLPLVFIFSLLAFAFGTLVVLVNITAALITGLICGSLATLFAFLEWV